MGVTRGTTPDTNPGPGSLLRPAVTVRDHSRGPADAVVTLVEYGDYECPYCRQAHPIVRTLQQELGEAGVSIRLVFRNFPLTEIHPHALHAAEAAESVAVHGGEAAFWAMHDAIFAHQRDSRTALSDQQLAGYAAAVGVDAALVARDLQNGTHQGRVRDDFMSGVRSGVNGTPTFFINGGRFDGNWADTGTFARALEQAAAEASRRRGPWSSAIAP